MSHGRDALSARGLSRDALVLDWFGTLVADAYALRLVATRFPVTLFTASNCGEGCALGRGLLAKRGVPYTERVAESEADGPRSGTP